MTDDNHTLSRDQRLRGRSRVSQLFGDGQSGFVYPLRYVWTESGSDQSGMSVLFNVPKRFHRRANKRNLLRRRVKEAYRLNQSLASVEGLPHLNVALIYSTKEELAYDQIERSVRRVLTQIAGERLSSVDNVEE